MKKLTLVLGEKEVEVPFGFTAASTWRQVLKGPLNDILTQVAQLDGVGKIDKVQDIIPALRAVAPFIIDLPDQIAAVLYGLPALAERKKELQEEASDEEHVAALVTALKAAFPFGGIIEALKSVRPIQQTEPGQIPTPTSTNSPSPSGGRKQQRN